MNYTYVKADKEYPVSFGNSALARFGRNAGMSLNALNNLSLDTLDLLNYFTLIWCGMADGHRKAKKAGEIDGVFALTVDDVMDISDEYPEFTNEVMQVFADSRAKAEAGNVKPQAAKQEKAK